MKNIEMKENNTPTSTGYYVCIQMEHNKTPQLVDVRISEGLDLRFHSGCSSFPLKDLDGEHCLWSDEIELTEILHFS